jgi:low affinity Fe/Cu permease
LRKTSERLSDARLTGGAHWRTGKLFGDIANRTSQAAGSALTFMIAAAVVIVWAITGPIFHYSDTWHW